MKHFFLILAMLLLNNLTTNAFGQYRDTLYIDKKIGNDSSIYSSYSWYYSNNYHYALEEIKLYKNGRYHFRSEYPLGDRDSSEGNYKIEKDILILNSDFQPDNVPVKINYIDTSQVDSNYRRLNFAINSKGQPLMWAFYVINSDSSYRNWFFPIDDTVFNKEVLSSIQRIKVRFSYNDFGSPWIPVRQDSSFIQVIVLTDKLLDDLRYKVFTDVRYKILKNKIVRVKSQRL